MIGRKSFLVDALLSQSAKHGGLSSDSVRWAWLLMMGAAKFQKHPGCFESAGHLQGCLGIYGRCSGELIKVFCNTATDGTVRIRNWKRWQPKSSSGRVQKWREAQQKLRLLKQERNA